MQGAPSISSVAGSDKGNVAKKWPRRSRNSGAARGRLGVARRAINPGVISI